MYDDHGEELFGHDGRHKPPQADLLTVEFRLHMSRQDEQDFSAYAIKQLGCVPKNYVIVNAREIPFNPDTALKVGHGRVAIPVKEFARAKRLTLKEQWELMNPQWVGSYFGNRGEDIYRNTRPNLFKAISEAKDADRLEEFKQQFWSAIYGHEEAIRRLDKRANELELMSYDLYDDYMTLKRKVEKVESDIHYQRYNYYHMHGYNVHEYLFDLKCKRSDAYWVYNETRLKAMRIRTFISNITFQQQCGLE